MQTERFTPTPVGNTPLVDICDKIPTVHPHACGEYSGQRFRIVFDDGSPPRLWGIRSSYQAYRRRLRFTPTPVGNTHHGHGIR